MKVTETVASYSWKVPSRYEKLSRFLSSTTSSLSNIFTPFEQSGSSWTPYHHCFLSPLTLFGFLLDQISDLFFSNEDQCDEDEGAR